jgi:hypothetical protein
LHTSRDALLAIHAGESERSLTGLSNDGGIPMFRRGPTVLAILALLAAGSVPALELLRVEGPVHIGDSYNIHCPPLDPEPYPWSVTFECPGIPTVAYLRLDWNDSNDREKNFIYINGVRVWTFETEDYGCQTPYNPSDIIPVDPGILVQGENVLTIDTITNPMDLDDIWIKDLILEAEFGCGGTLVAATSEWTGTGQTFASGDGLTIAASGVWRMTSTYWNGPDGSGPAGSGYPLPDAPRGALIGRVGDGPVFLVGSYFSGVSPASGELFLGPNEPPGGLGDNAGALCCNVIPGAEPACWPTAPSYVELYGIPRPAGGTSEFLATVGLFQVGEAVRTILIEDDLVSQCLPVPPHHEMFSGTGCEETDVYVSYVAGPDCREMRMLISVLDGSEPVAPPLHQRIVSDYEILSPDDLPHFPYSSRRALLQAYAPILKLATDEAYAPVAIEVSTGAAELAGTSWLPEYFGDVTPQLLARYSWSEFALDLPGTMQDLDDLPAVFESLLQSHPGNDYAVYATAYLDRQDPANQYDDLVFLQYWFNYWTNVVPGGGLCEKASHEGDWEHVSVLLDRELNPVAVYFAQHDGGEAIPWNENGDLERVGNHVVVYVARGTHASYPSPGSDQIMGCTDLHDGGGSWFAPPGVEGGYTEYELIEVPRWSDLSALGEEGRWIKYSGKWGKDKLLLGKNPRGPAFHQGWWDTYGTEFAGGEFIASSPVELLVEDPFGRVTGPDSVGIPGSSYEVSYVPNGADTFKRRIQVKVPGLEPGSYTVRVVPLEAAPPGSHYTLFFRRDRAGVPPDTIWLAVDQPLSQIPPEGYMVLPDVPVTSPIEPVPDLWELGWEPSDTNSVVILIGSKPGRFDATSIDPASIRLNGTVSPTEPVEVLYGDSLAMDLALEEPILAVRFPRGAALESLGDLESRKPSHRITLTADVIDFPAGYESYAFVRVGLSHRSGRGTGARSGGDGPWLRLSGGNPSVGGISVRLWLPETMPVDVSVYDVLGRRVAAMAQGQLSAGRYDLRLASDENGRALQSGVYFVRGRLGDRRIIRRVVIVK